MSYWEGSTSLEVRDAAQVARDSVYDGFKRMGQRIARKRIKWDRVPSADGGAFDTFNDSPAWSARAHFTDPKHSGGAICDVFVFDRGSTRQVRIEISHSFAYGSNAKAMANGIITALS